MTDTPSARTDSPTARLIDDALEMSPKTLREIAREIGFPRGNVLSMMRSGEMRLPIERAPALARALGIDQHLLIKTAMNENVALQPYGRHCQHADLRPCRCRSGVRNILKMKAQGLEVGPILMGLGNRAHIVTPSITARGLLNMAAIAGTPVEHYG